jgi:hypothetical protein
MVHGNRSIGCSPSVKDTETETPERDSKLNLTSNTNRKTSKLNTRYDIQKAILTCTFLPQTSELNMQYDAPNK